MNDIWELLGIEPTDDKKIIRRAYAEQSRLHHPEEEPEYFTALNQAYKAALDHGIKLKNTENMSDSEKGSTEVRETQKIQKEQEISKTQEIQIIQETQTIQKTSKEQDNQATQAIHEIPKIQEISEASESKSSLLKILDAAQEQAVKASMETGALHEFIVLFENPQRAKQADTWKRFFLSEVFLKEQFTEEFGKGLFTYLSEQDLFSSDNLPMGLLQELAVAYAFIPHFAGEEYFDEQKYPKEWYKVSVENTFPGRRFAAEIFNMQGRECDLKSMTGRILRQPANKVRHNAFSDYLAIKEMGRNGRLTEGEKEIWQHILGVCQPFYLYERNGKQRGSGAYEARSECVVKLYVQWLKDEQAPRDVLLFLYKKLDLKDLERSSTRGLYSALKEQILRQCPHVEEILFGEGGTEQRITKLYRIYSAIINDHHNNYDKFIYGETPEIRDRANAFFALSEWEELKGEKGLFDRICSISKRIVMPRTVAEKMIEHLSQGDFPEPERTELTESLLRSLSTEKMLRELDYRYEISLDLVDLGEIGSSPDFWQYFLMRGFGFRHGKIRGEWEEDFIYTEKGQCYLPAYINYIYAPSRAWQRRFVGFDEYTEEIQTPVDVVCSMPGNRRLRVEFHYHYCLYFVDGVQVTAPVLTFSELRDYVECLEKPKEFFFLLAVTAIENTDRKSAQLLIETWLKRIPIHSFIIPTVARLLAADNDRIPVSALNAESFSREEDMACRDWEVYAAVHTRKNFHEASEKRVEAVFYGEQERFCFRVLVSREGLSIWKQIDYGWQDIIFRSADLGWKKWKEYKWKEFDSLKNWLKSNAVECAVGEAQVQTEKNISGSSALQSVAQGRDVRFPAAGTDTFEGRKGAALKMLDNLRQPRPRVRAVYSLEGMDVAQKAAKIYEAMGCAESMEGYCVLRYGEKKEKRHDRVFYGVHAPFGFDLKAQSTAYVRSREFLMSSSNTKIKEPKVLVGRFGWGFKYSPSSDYGPMYVYQGQSGTYYAYGFRMHRAERLEQLLCDFYRKEWEGVTEVEACEGCLTVSRFDHRLEYCYTEEDMRQSMGSLGDTAADRFTLFGGYRMWEEFSRWMDGMLSLELPSWVNAIAVSLDWEMDGALTFTGLHEKYMVELDAWEEGGEEEPDTEDSLGSGGSQQDEVFLPQSPLLIWAKGMDRADRMMFLTNALQWYVDCGKFAENTGGRKIKIVNLL